MSKQLINWLSEKFLEIKDFLDNSHTMSDIEYQIVDFNQLTDCYTLQSTRDFSVYQIKTVTLITNVDILARIHPKQAYYLGLAHHKNQLIDIQAFSSAKQSSTYQLHSLTRKSHICLLNKVNKELNIFSLEQIANNDILGQFDALHALYMGAILGKHLNIAIDG